MPRTARKFELTQARREAVPVMLGIMGATGSGKTYSALRVATGIVSVTGGDIALIDTEGKRGLHHADKFNYRRMAFEPPFGALDYLDAIKQCEAEGARCVIIDSMSHEHEGEGGLLDRVEAFLDRRAGDDFNKRNRLRMAAYIEPKRERSTLVQYLERSTTNVILCFKAKERVKPVLKGGKMEIQEFGWEPIGGDELAYAMTAMCLLKPNAQGVPTWSVSRPGEGIIVKRPEMFRHFLENEQAPLSEDTGKRMAAWCAGEDIVPRGDDVTVQEQAEIEGKARAAARRGGDELQRYWQSCDERQRDVLRDMGSELRELADAADADADSGEIEDDQS